MRVPPKAVVFGTVFTRLFHAGDTGTKYSHKMLGDSNRCEKIQGFGEIKMTINLTKWPEPKFFPVVWFEAKSTNEVQALEALEERLKAMESRVTDEAQSLELMHLIAQVNMKQFISAREEIYQEMDADHEHDPYCYSCFDGGCISCTPEMFLDYEIGGEQ